MSTMPCPECRIEGCERPSRYRGKRLCGMHYQRQYHHGSFDDPAPTREERFLAKVEKGEGCWMWTAGVTTSGYGKFENSYAHRVALELWGVAPTAEEQVDHLCRVRLCVNPAHLESVSQAENLRRQNEFMVRDELGRMVGSR